MINEQDGQIIIDSLRPMSEAPKFKGLATIALVFDEYSEIPSMVVYYPHPHGHGWARQVSGAIGWAYMPIYKPKKADE